MATREAVIQKANELAAQGRADDARALLRAWKARQAAPSEPVGGGVMEGPLGGVRSAVQGMTFGWGDELIAGARSLLPGYDYETELKRERDALKRHGEDYGASRTIGEISGGLGTGGATGRLVNPQTWKGLAAVGALEGGLYGAGAAEEHRKAGAALGATGGAAVSTAMPLAGAAFRWGKQLLTPGQKDVPRRVLGRLVRATGETPEELVERRIARGPEATLADVDPRMRRQLAESGVESTTEAKGILDAQMRNRSAGRASRLQGMAEDELGPGRYAEQLQQIKAGREAAAKPLYDQAFEAGVDLTGKPIKSLLARPSMKKALKQADTYAKEEGGLIEGNAHRLHYAKMSLDDQISKAKGNKRRQLVQTKQELVDFMDESMPGYAEARAIYSDSFANQRALDAGADIFKGKFSRAKLENLTQDMSVSEKEAFRVGLKEAISDQFEVSGKLTPRQEAALRNMFEPEEWAQMSRRLEDEGVLAKTEAKVIGAEPASLTRERPAGRLTAGAGMTSLGMAIGGAIETLMGRAAQISPQAHSQIARILSDPNITPQQIRQAAEMLSVWERSVRGSTAPALIPAAGAGIGVLQE